MIKQQLCIRLLAAESEIEVQEIIDASPEMSDPKNWEPLDGRDSNFNVVTNQAMTGGKAATELMTNMVDAILMKSAYQKGISPSGRGDDVPRSMYDAVDKLIYNLHGGKLEKAEENWLREYSSKNLVVGITGSRGSKKAGGAPCFTFADNGEGQNADDFKDTFLSLSKGIKKDIRFVQGKYNMGSSGVLSFCGECWFKLIISRHYDKAGRWGWTLIRRRPEADMPIADYFQIDGKIQSFDMDYLFPFNKKNGERFEGFVLSSGTVIKLYDFFLGSGYGGFRGAREAFNENLVESILPFRIYDFRYNPDPAKGGLRADGIDARPFYGMEYLLLRSHTEDEEEEGGGPGAETESKLTIAEIRDPCLGKIHLTAIPLKKKIPGWLQPQKSNNRIFHAVNGQVQFKQTRGYLSQCGYPALKDRVVIIVDASELTDRAHNDVWKGDREHLRETHAGDNYKSVVKEAIQKSEILKELQQKIAREELTQTTKKESSDIFQKLVDNDRNIADLLNDRFPSIVLPGMEPNDEDKYEGKFSPTFLELESRLRDDEVEIPVNKSRPVSAKTDVVNDYFHRADNRGYLYISDDEVERYFRIRQSLKDGRLTVYFAPARNTDLALGMKFSFQMGLQDSAMALPVAVPITLVVTEATPEPNIEPTPRPKPTPKPNEKPKKGLPIYKLLTKDGRKIFDEDTEKWTERFNEYDGGTIEDFGEEGLIYKINYDNVYHLKYRQGKKSQIEQDALTQKYILGMRLLMLGFEHAIRHRQDVSNDQSFEDHKDEFRQMVAKGAASTVLALAEVLPKVVGIPDEEPE